MIDYGSSQSKKQYTRRIGENGFLGADFSTAPIFASPRRFRDMKNVWKDYKSGSGVAIETVPGFREVLSIANAGGTEHNPAKINGVYQISVEKGTTYRDYDISGNWFILHYGRKLVCAREQDDGRSDRYVVGNGENGMGLTDHLINAPSIAIPVSDKLVIFCQPDYEVSFVPTAYVLKVTTNADFWGEVEPSTDSEQVFALYKLNSIQNPGYMQGVSPLFAIYVPTTYINGDPYEQKNMLTLSSREKYSEESVEVGSGSTHFDVVLTLHEKVKAENFASGTNKLKNIESFVIDGTSVTIDKNTTNPVVTTVTIGGVDYVSSLSYKTMDAEAATHKVEIVYKSDATQFTSYKYYDDYKDRTTFNEGSPDYAGTAFDAIAGCTICASFDERIFLAGNPKLPNTVFYSQRDLTGYNNPTYFGVLNYNNLGTSNAPITALVPSANVLYALKDDSATDPTMYVLTGQTTEIDLIPRIYTVESGLPGIGCKGAACNFLDDIVFMSKNGVIGIDKQAVNLERTLGDRSALINGKLLLEDVTQAVFAEAEGYLWCLFKNNGHVYLADSRAYTEGAGYEWYFIDSVGSWENDADGYEYVNDLADLAQDDNGYTLVSYAGCTVETSREPVTVTAADLDGLEPAITYTVVQNENAGATYTGDKTTVYLEYTFTNVEQISARSYTATVSNDTDGDRVYLVETSSGSGKYYQIKPTGEKVGGTFYPATCMVAANDRILFGTEDGKILTFNNDKRGVQSESEIAVRAEDNPNGDTDIYEQNRYPFLLRPEWYTFCGHRIESFVETSDDDGGIGNLTKDTVRRSVVVDMKAMLGSRYKITTYTDRDGWKNDNAATGSMNDASQTMLDAVNFSGDEHINVQIRERARKWVHKRYRIESNGFRSPFGLYRITYNFEINGRIK